jgi:adenine-specific DNA-methyltransferase
LTGDDEMPSMRGHINLIYGEPQPDAAMHCRPASRPEGFEHTGKVPKRLPYGGVRTRNIASYLAALAPRLIMMRELLSEHGSIFLHLDWHTACYTKIMMDEIFNRNKFIGQIIRYYPQAPHEKAATGIKMHRIIFQYTKSENRPVNDANFQFKAGGKTDVLAWHAAKKIANPATGHSAIERPHGCMARLGGRHPAQQAPENLQLSHQQEHGALLERIIKTSSHEGSMIADFFSDSGKTAEVAERLGRRWITSDFDEPACMLARRRLKEQCVSSFVYQTIGND